MALLAEEIVEEWLNRQGYFTIRGVKLGVHEIDLLAIKPDQSGGMECRHIEVQASMRPISYISKVPKKIQKETGKSANSAKRSDEELVEGVKEWVANKYDRAEKIKLMNRLAKGQWSKELVVHNVKLEEELDMIKSHGVEILRLKDIVGQMGKNESVIKYAAGADLVDLINLAEEIES